MTMMPQKTANILVIKLSALGDFIQALGAMQAIRRHHPEARITLLTTKPFEGFARDCGYFDDVWLDDRPKWYQFGKMVEFRARLDKAEFDRVYDLQNNDRTGGYFKLLANPKPEWVGVAKGASHRNTSPERTAGHAFDGHKQTLSLVGINDVCVDDLSWMIGDVSDYALKDRYAILVPGSAPQHPHKRWPTQSYGDAANALAEQGIQPVVIGTQDESEVCVEICRICPDALNLNAQTNLYQIVALARNAEMAIGNDTGPIHLIAASGCNAVVLFSGQSNPIRHAPRGDHVVVLREENIENIAVKDVIKAALPKAP
jgi:ADP-heptose:LPS heptosyltransferase